MWGRAGTRLLPLLVAAAAAVVGCAWASPILQPAGAPVAGDLSKSIRVRVQAKIIENKLDLMEKQLLDGTLEAEQKAAHKQVQALEKLDAEQPTPQDKRITGALLAKAKLTEATFAANAKKARAWHRLKHPMSETQKFARRWGMLYDLTQKSPEVCRVDTEKEWDEGVFVTEMAMNNGRFVRTVVHSSPRRDEMLLGIVMCENKLQSPVEQCPAESKKGPHCACCHRRECVPSADAPKRFSHPRIRELAYVARAFMDANPYHGLDTVLGAALVAKKRRKHPRDLTTRVLLLGAHTGDLASYLAGQDPSVHVDVVVPNKLTRTLLEDCLGFPRADQKHRVKVDGRSYAAVLASKPTRHYDAIIINPLDWRALYPDSSHSQASRHDTHRRWKGHLLGRRRRSRHGRGGAEYTMHHQMERHHRARRGRQSETLLATGAEVSMQTRTRAGQDAGTNGLLSAVLFGRVKALLKSGGAVLTYIESPSVQCSHKLRVTMEYRFGNVWDFPVPDPPPPQVDVDRDGNVDGLPDWEKHVLGKAQIMVARRCKPLKRGKSRKTDPCRNMKVNSAVALEERLNRPLVAGTIKIGTRFTPPVNLRDVVLRSDRELAAHCDTRVIVHRRPLRPDEDTH